MTIIQTSSELSTGISNDFSQTDPLTDTELLKIAEDVLHGLKYSFLAAATNQEKAFAPGSVEENFRLAIATRKPEKRASYQSIAKAIAAQTTVERQLSFGRYANLSIEEYSRKGFAATRLPALQLDSAKLAAAVKQIQIVPVATAPLAAVAEPSAIHTLSGGKPSAKVKSVGFYITEVRCVDETDGFLGSELGEDEIQIGGMGVDEVGNTFKIKPFDVKNKKGDFDENDNPVVTYPFPGKLFYQFDTTKTTFWPKNYAAIVYLAEVDNGGFADFLTDAWKIAGDAIKGALTTAGIAIFGGIGAVISKVLGWILDKLVGWLIDVLKDDIFAPGTAPIHLDTAAGITYVNSAGWSNLCSTEGKFTFKGHGGKYTVKCRWKVEIA